jgi:hypothetical protein
MFLKRQKFSGALGVPYFACPIIRASDELVSRFVESTVGQR